MQKIYSVGTNKKTDFYGLWQQHKLLKTIRVYINNCWSSFAWLIRDTHFIGPLELKANDPSKFPIVQTIIQLPHQNKEA